MPSFTPPPPSNYGGSSSLQYFGDVYYIKIFTNLFCKFYFGAERGSSGYFLPNQSANSTTDVKSITKRLDKLIVCSTKREIIERLSLVFFCCRRTRSVCSGVADLSALLCYCCVRQSLCDLRYHSRSLISK